MVCLYVDVRAKAAARAESVVQVAFAMGFSMIRRQAWTAAQR